MASAATAALCLAGVVFVLAGPGERGTIFALQATARLSFLLFWVAYTSSAVVALGGTLFLPLKRRAREFGLAFASAQSVHFGLVAWLCYVGTPPPFGTFIFFGIALVWTYLLALFSIARLQRAIGPWAWWLLRLVALNYIAYAFASDFVRAPYAGTAKYVLGYLPFVVLSLLGPLLNLMAFVLRELNLLRLASGRRIAK